MSDVVQVFREGELIEEISLDDAGLDGVILSIDTTAIREKIAEATSVDEMRDLMVKVIDLIETP